jgi:hypothetical protein
MSFDKIVSDGKVSFLVRDREFNLKIWEDKNQIDVFLELKHRGSAVYKDGKWFYLSDPKLLMEPHQLLGVFTTVEKLIFGIFLCRAAELAALKIMSEEEK